MYEAKNSDYHFNDFFGEMLETFSHELAHILEGKGDMTHNENHKKLQIKVLKDLLRKPKLYSEIYDMVKNAENITNIPSKYLIEKYGVKKLEE